MHFIFMADFSIWQIYILQNSGICVLIKINMLISADFKTTNFAKFAKYYPEHCLYVISLNSIETSFRATMGRLKNVHSADAVMP